MKTIYAIDIIWDTDNENVDLPTKVRIPNNIPKEELADYLSDTFGWCIKSLNYMTE